MLTQHYDVLVVGSGVSGLNTALSIDPKYRVLMLCKKDINLSNSSLAQGGIASVWDKAYDNAARHVRDTFIAGGFENDPLAVAKLVCCGPEAIRRLLYYGVEFDRSQDGSEHLTLEGGHSCPRILHYKDSTGAQLVEKMVLRAQEQPNITIMEHTYLSEIQKEQNGFSCTVLSPDDTYYDFTCRFAVFATGGIGRVYESTTNSAIATGDGITFAYQMGAKIKDLSWIQFHPTAYARKDRERFLISESVRGEGAYLLNCNHERFMQKYDPRGELAPRDVVSHFIMLESEKTQSKDFYIDITREDSAFVKSRFPMIYQHLLKEGIDMTKDPIPVYPCQHYLMGGIAVDLHARTTVDHLYAVGECSCTGVHGHNRLASNSLLEAVVFSSSAAKDINEKLDAFSYPALTCKPIDTTKRTRLVPSGIRTEIRSIMQEIYFVIPKYDRIRSGLTRVTELLTLLQADDFILDSNYIEAKSLATVAKIILEEVLQSHAS